MHASYEPEWTNRFWRVLVCADRVLKEHRSRFRGKTTPVQLWWGSFDLAYCRFAGRLAVAEHTALGFWPGDKRFPHAAFYAYTSPKPAGIESATVEPDAAFWSAEMGEFLLPYDAVRTSTDPRAALLALYKAHPGKPFAILEWGLWNLDDPAFVTRMGAFLTAHPRTVIASYYSGRPGSIFDLASKPCSLAEYRKVIAPLGR